MRRSAVQHWREFGAALRALRDANGYGLRRFARAVHIDSGYLTHIEAGQTPPPSNEFLARMAEVLEVPPPQLFTQAGRPALATIS